MQVCNQAQGHLVTQAFEAEAEYPLSLHFSIGSAI